MEIQTPNQDQNLSVPSVFPPCLIRGKLHKTEFETCSKHFALCTKLAWKTPRKKIQIFLHFFPAWFSDWRFGQKSVLPFKKPPDAASINGVLNLWFKSII